MLRKYFQITAETTVRVQTEQLIATVPQALSSCLVVVVAFGTGIIKCSLSSNGAVMTFRALQYARR